MADNTIKIGGELESMATGKIVAAASAIKDKSRNKTQEAINGDVEAAIAEQSVLFGALSEETSRGVASASKSAREAKQYLADLQEAITELPDGQAVSAQVAINEVDIAGLKSDVVVDLSTRYATSYANLSAALTALNSDTATDASVIKKAGVSIKFLNSTTNEYEQWSLKASSWSTNISDWGNTNVTQASEIGYGNKSVAEVLDVDTSMLLQYSDFRLINRSVTSGTQITLISDYKSDTIFIEFETENNILSSFRCTTSLSGGSNKYDTYNLELGHKQYAIELKTYENTVSKSIDTVQASIVQSGTLKMIMHSPTTSDAYNKSFTEQEVAAVSNDFQTLLLQYKDFKILNRSVSQAQQITLYSGYSSDMVCLDFENTNTILASLRAITSIEGGNNQLDIYPIELGKKNYCIKLKTYENTTSVTLDTVNASFVQSGQLKVLMHSPTTSDYAIISQMSDIAGNVEQLSGSVNQLANSVADIQGGERTERIQPTTSSTGYRITDSQLYADASYDAAMYKLQRGNIYDIHVKGRKNQYSSLWAIVRPNTLKPYIALASSSRDFSEDDIENVDCTNEELWLYVNRLVAEDNSEVTLSYNAQSAITIAENNAKQYTDDKLRYEPLPRYKNPCYPNRGENLRILMLGNSFMQDATAYMSEILSGSGIDTSKIAIHVISVGGRRLQGWVDGFESSTVVTPTRYGSLSMSRTSGTLSEIVAQNWDIVCLQGSSEDNVDWDNFSSNVMNLVKKVKENVLNQRCMLAYMSPQSKGSDESSAYNNQKLSVGFANYSKIVYEMAKIVGIDYIVPVCAAIQNLRNQSEVTQDPYHDFTRDGQHLCYGVGRYTSACCVFQSLIAPFFDISIVGNTAVHALTSAEQTISDSNRYLGADVTLSNKEVLQKCAFNANIERFYIPS